MATSIWAAGLPLLLCALASISCTAEAGCTEINRCCPGRNSSCYFALDERSSPCYCDEFCTKSKDCCSDYDYFCRKQDCVVTYWSHWSECRPRCGRGKQERTREIHVHPTSGGKPCGRLSQRRICHNSASDCERKEIALLLPTYYKPYRNHGYFHLQEERPDRPNYCIRYRVTYVSPYCQYDTPWHMVKSGDMVCAECDDVAMKTNGKCKGAYTGSSGRWKGVATHNCYGMWKSEGELVENCECGYKHGLDFIFV